MSRIVLATLNARYIHTSFGLRYLLANMGDLRDETVLREFTINDNIADVVGEILSHSPDIIGIGVYIWNVDQSARLIADLRVLRPDVVLVVGGPEVSYDSEELEFLRLVDYVISGEADLEFPLLCRRLLLGERPPGQRIAATPPKFDQLRLPYALYSDEDLADRVLYVEASRGCPFTCEFCLSALDIPVRQADLDAFLAEMQRLLDRGARQFKFVDRTFNLNLRVSQSILQFFLERYEPGLFLHFELIPDRLPESLRTLIVQFPAGALQFEIGVQTFSEHVGQLISRPQNVAALEDNFRFLRNQTGVHIHADLIVGLPAETLEQFGAGFDRLYALRPQEIQIGILKRLRGTPIVRHDAEWEMIYSRHAPYEILQTKTMSFAEIRTMRQFARYWDLVANSGNFPQSLSLICNRRESAFAAFRQLAAWLFQRTQQTHGISLLRLAQHVFEYLQEATGLEPDAAAHIVWADYSHTGRRDRPEFLRDFTLPAPASVRDQQLPARQRRHLPS